MRRCGAACRSASHSARSFRIPPPAAVRRGNRGFDKAGGNGAAPLNAALRSALDSMQAGIDPVRLERRGALLKPPVRRTFRPGRAAAEKIKTFDGLSEKAAGKGFDHRKSSPRDGRRSGREIARSPRKKWRCNTRGVAFWSGSRCRCSIPGAPHGMAGNLHGCDRLPADPVEDAPDRKDGGAGGDCFGDRTRVE